MVDASCLITCHLQSSRRVRTSSSNSGRMQQHTRHAVRLHTGYGRSSLNHCTCSSLKQHGAWVYRQVFLGLLVLRTNCSSVCGGLRARLSHCELNCLQPSPIPYRCPQAAYLSAQTLHWCHLLVCLCCSYVLQAAKQRAAELEAQRKEHIRAVLMGSHFLEGMSAWQQTRVSDTC